jgi:DNA-binding response OmpR family regulator
MYTVLLVESDPIPQLEHAYQHFLQQIRRKPEIHVSMVSQLPRDSSTDYHVILLDLSLPDKTAKEVIDFLQTKPRVPVLVATHDTLRWR